MSEDFENNKGYYYKSITSATLKGLGFSEDEFASRINTLSGGQKMRVALAKMLIKQPELLMLDEPTNYLDINGISWLEGYLAGYPNSYIVVSHDRYFLDKTVTAIWGSGHNNKRIQRQLFRLCAPKGRRTICPKPGL